MRYYWTELRDYFLAVLEDPTGVLCAKCWKPNFFFDDIGWFYKNTTKGKYRAHCRECNGPLTGDR